MPHSHHVRAHMTYARTQMNSRDAQIADQDLQNMLDQRQTADLRRWEVADVDPNLSWVFL